VADKTTVQDGSIADPATWGGALPTAAQTVEIVNNCTLGDGESFTSANLTITNSLTTSGTCSIAADVILNNNNAVALTQSSGTLAGTGSLTTTAAPYGATICAVAGDAITWDGDVTLSKPGVNLFAGTASTAIVINGDLTDSSGGSGTLFSGSFGDITITGIYTVGADNFGDSGPLGNLAIGALLAPLDTCPYFPNASSITIGPSGAAAYPAAGEVLSGVTFGPNGNDYTGTYAGPTVDKVLSGYQYGPGDRLTGTLPVSGTLTPDERNAIADAVLSRAAANVEATADPHSLCYVVLAMSESDATTHPGKLTVFCSDGATEFVQKTISAQTGAATITGVH
jgi:hypothetical protein